MITSHELLSFSSVKLSSEKSNFSKHGHVSQVCLLVKTHPKARTTTVFFAHPVNSSLGAGHDK